MSLALWQPAAGAPFELTARTPDDGPEPLLEVLACSPGIWDLRASPAVWPHLPGAVLAARAEDGTHWLCGGMLPCGRCPRCRAALHLACDEPQRPGWNRPGGMATGIRLPAGLAPAEMVKDRLARVVALLAAAGPTYQAQVLAGMVPGDAVVVAGEPGPGALPLRLLVAEGLRPIWVSSAAEAPEGVELRPELPAAGELPSARCHLIDLAPTLQSLQGWQPLARACLSLSLLGPPRPLAAELDPLLNGQASLRWVRDLHPHLVLDMAALVSSQRVCLDDLIEIHPLNHAGAALEALRSSRCARWPVVVP